MKTYQEIITGSKRGTTLAKMLHSIASYYTGLEVYVMEWHDSINRMDEFSTYKDDVVDIRTAFQFEFERETKREAEGLKSPSGYLISKVTDGVYEELGNHIILDIFYFGKYKSLADVHYKVFVFFSHAPDFPNAKHVEKPQFPWWLLKKGLN